MVYHRLVSAETGLFYLDIIPGDGEMGMKMDSHAKRMKERIAAIKKAHPNYAGILDLFEKLFLEQLKTKVQVDYRPLKISEDHVRIRAMEGFPILSKGDFFIDPQRATRLFALFAE